MQEPELNLMTICKGAIPEVFDRVLAALVRNIKDPNTSAQKKRTVTIEITLAPFKDRSGWVDTFVVNSKPAGFHTEEVQGTAFIATQEGELKVFAHDTRQTALFAAEATPTPRQ